MQFLFVSFFICFIAAFPVEAAETDTSQPAFLSEVLSHYSEQSDSLHRDAARFLVENMHDHGFVAYDLKDTNDQIIAFNVLDYENLEELEAAFKELESRHGTLDFKKRELVRDDSVMTARFLINHIDNAFRAWQSHPWAARLSYEQFRDYVLPYRGSNEPLEAIPADFRDRLEQIAQQMTNPEDPIEAASLINQDLISWFHFDPRFYYHPTDQSLSEMMKGKLGRCEDMTNLTMYAMRACGLAVTSDFTPYWANSGNNHAWNAIVLPEGEVIPFMGAEANPRSYHLANKVAKVYRKTYAIQKNGLAFQTDNPDSLPRYLASRYYTDVTADYTDTRDLTLGINAQGSPEFAYLCVFNSGEWQPIQWGRVENGTASFIAMGVDVAYLPGLYSKDEVVPAGEPFLLTKTGEIQTLSPQMDQSVTLVLASTTGAKQQESTDSINKSSLIPGTTYELHYWQDGWQLFGTKVAGDQQLEFVDAPGDALYWLTAKDSDKEERIFTWENQTQVWW
ncbi:transglutaminase-like domain-containing protein [bacterium]|nr:transglutaminase-like domain-containing protein [bacterium]